VGKKGTGWARTRGMDRKEGYIGAFGRKSFAALKLSKAFQVEREKSQTR